MGIHKEGRVILSSLLAALAIINLFVFYFLPDQKIAQYICLGASLIIFILVLQFFRVPKRKVNAGEFDVVCPADGKVVVIEEVLETEVFNDKRIQVSVFMSPLNVHVNWFPISGLVSFFKYHPGKFLVAWHPKSSTENERTTVVVDHQNGQRVLFRQIAGAVARRIVWYVREKNEAQSGEQFGFIKFGSRIDIFLPLDAEIKVKIGDKVTGKSMNIAKLNSKK
jgi:phosphatidylserine decarboxylase